jgi:polysaccharide biosynthesis/export protein
VLSLCKLAALVAGTMIFLKRLRMTRLKISSHLPWPVACLLCLICGFGFLPPASGQTPSADQIEMYRNLPPDQQQAIMETLGIGGSGSSRGAGTQRADRQVNFPQTVNPRSTDKEDLDDFTEEVDPLTGQKRRTRKLRLKGEDTILLTIEVREREGQQLPRKNEPEQSPRTYGPRVEQDLRAQPTLPGQQQTDNERGKEIERSDEERRRLDDLRDRLLRRNPYKLDKWGILNVPELGPIPLAGLTVEEATQRLSAEVALRDFLVEVTRLALKPVGTEALKPFGYDLFAGVPTTFAPATDVPVPAEYVVGPGDQIEVQLIGNTKGRYTLAVGRDGRINFPELGPIAVSGLRFDDVRSMLEARVRDQMIGTQVSVGIGQLRSIRVFVLGDVEVPGSYTVSGLATMTNALFASGGVKEIGSLRNIELKRNGSTVSRLDLYDLLLKGDSRADARLLPGDVIFIPSVGPTVGLAGEVRRPAIYELKDETSVADLLRLGGGLTPKADPKLATLERISDGRQRITLDVNLSESASQGRQLKSGDTLRVPEIRPVLEDSVSLSGHVFRPGEFEYRKGMRITDLIPSVDELKPNADYNYILVRRELPPDRRVTVFSADIQAALANPSSAENFELAPRDRVYVFDLESGRDRVIEPLMRDLRMQSQFDQPTSEVSVAGKIKVPGRYPHEPGMRVLDLIRAGGNLDEAAYGAKAELTRYAVEGGEQRKAELIEIDLARVLSGDPTANIPLQPFDYLVIKGLPLWAATEEVEIRGEVKFPGRYPIHRGETLRSVMERAGGLTDFAFMQGAVFTRTELKERERKQLETLANRMQSDLTQLSLQAAQETGRDPAQALAVGQSLLANLRSTQAVGRLVIDLDRSMAARPGSEHDIILKGGDMLLVPRVTQEVTVLGEVQSATSHLYRAELRRDDYIDMSGGLTTKADDNRIYVVRADGSVVTRAGNSWFSGGVQIKNGDTIVVPLDTERMRPLPLWQAITTIVSNLAISAAAINSFSN